MARRAKTMNTVELLLGLDTETITKVPEDELEISRLSKLAGAKFVVKVKALSGRQIQRVEELATVKGKRNDFDASLLVCVYGVTSPDLNNEDLKAKFGAASPKDLVENLFRPGEVAKIGKAIMKLSGSGMDDEEEIKN